MVSGFPCYFCQLVAITFLILKFWVLPSPPPFLVSSSSLDFFMWEGERLYMDLWSLTVIVFLLQGELRR